MRSLSSSSYFCILILFSVLSFISCDIPGDLINSLPGYAPGTPPTKQYSGLMEVDIDGRYLHYWFVESSNNPATDPVTLWLNGGPGCSSLDGYFYEHGPFSFSGASGSDGIPILIDNPYSWNTVSNMIYLESPAGVGFSYSNNPNDYNTNDNITASDNWKFLNNFFQAYPEYAKNQFFIAGESYAGVYVPTLAYEVLQQNAAGASNINLVGILVGNGCTGNEVGSCSPQGNAISVDFLYGHGLFSKITRDAITANCPDLSNPNSACQDALSQMGNEVGHVDVYNIYAPCISGPDSKFRRERASTPLLSLMRENRKSSKLGGPDGCIDSILASAYLNNDKVRTAIHVQNMNTLQDWMICTANINYNPNTPNLPATFYPTLIQNLRVQIFNGDVDACVPYNGNEQWTSGMGYPVKSSWNQWEINGQVAGYTTDYFVSTQFTFVTVKGAGHMVAQYQPVAGLYMFEHFIKNQPLN